jgi:hypothetical protein
MRIRSWISAPLLVLVAQATAMAQPPEGVPGLAKAASRVVVATVGDVSARWETNEHGDEVIVSDVTLHVEESLKGAAAKSLGMTILGGTVGDITLEVSSTPTLKRGERAVFFLEANPKGRLVPHRRGQGILKLDSGNRVQGTDVDLSQIRQMAAAAGKQ